MMIGEHRPPVAELLWMQAECLINETDGITEEDKQQMMREIKDMKTHEEIFDKAKKILKHSNTDQQSNSQDQYQFRKVLNFND